METRYSEDVEKPREKSGSGSWEVDEPAKVRPEFGSGEERMPHADQIEDKEPHRYIPIQRNSIFNHTVRHKSKDTARDAREPKAGLVADSLENGKSLKEPRTLNLPQSGMSLWQIPTRTNPGAQRTRCPPKVPIRTGPGPQEQPLSPVPFQGSGRAGLREDSGECARRLDDFLVARDHSHATQLQFLLAFCIQKRIQLAANTKV